MKRANRILLILFISLPLIAITAWTYLLPLRVLYYETLLFSGNKSLRINGYNRLFETGRLNTSLRAMVTGQDPEPRNWALPFLVAHPEIARPIQPTIIAIFRDNKEPVDNRVIASQILCSLRPETAFNAAVHATRSLDVRIQSAAFRIVLSLGAQNPKARSFIFDAIASKASNTRPQAIQCLQYARKDTIPTLLVGVKDEREIVRILCVQALGHAGATTERPTLRATLLNDPSLKVREAAKKTLQTLEFHYPEAKKPSSK